MNKTGKTLTIFIVLIIVLLASSTSIGFYLYHKEQHLFQKAEVDLQASQETGAKLQVQLKDIQKQLGLAQDKNKEADDKINNLLDQIDLDTGVRDALKKENAGLKQQLDTANKAVEAVKTHLNDSKTKLDQLQQLLKAEQDKSKDLQGQVGKLEGLKKSMETKIKQMKADMSPYSQRSPSAQVDPEIIPPGYTGKDKVELDKIVVNPQDGTKGHILSVDKDAEFVVFNLGLKQGVKPGDMLSVYRGDEYLGDVKATRVQDELSAADIVPPFSSGKVRQNDTVVLKP